MRFPVRPELTTASAVHGLCMDHDHRYGQLCTVLNPPHRTYLSGFDCSDQPSHFLDQVIKGDAAADNTIDQIKINRLKEKIVQSLLISSFMKSLSQELAKKPIIGVIPIEYLSSAAEKLIVNNQDPLDLKTFESSAKLNRNFNQKEVRDLLQNMVDNFNFPSAYSELQKKLKTSAVPKQ